MKLDERYCFDIEEVYLRASWYAAQYNYIDIYINPCVNSTSNPVVCKPQEEIDAVIGNTYFEVLFFHPIIDFSKDTDFQWTIDENHFFYLNPDNYLKGEILI